MSKMKRESKVIICCIIVLVLAWMMTGCEKEEQSTPLYLTDFYIGGGGELFMVTFYDIPRRDTCLFMSADDGDTWRRINAPPGIYRVASIGQKWFLLAQNKLHYNANFIFL